MNNQDFNKKTDKIKTAVFFGAAAIFFLIGLLLFLRPKVSENEKRELTKFPKFTVSSFLSGEFTNQVSLWYSDTYPLREAMISADGAIESLYGIRNEQMISGETGDDIPDETMPPIDLDGEIEWTPTDDGKGEQLDGLYVNGNTAYQLYAFSEENSKNYVKLINKFANQVKGEADVYTLIAPLHYQTALSKDTAAKYGASDGEAAIDYIYSGFSGTDVVTVDALDELYAHNTEYLYYRTDHHWTARGAYYAYVAFCQAKGITPTPLEDYKRLQFDGFLGTLYAKAKEPAAMRNDPDYVEAFVPIGTNENFIVTDRDGNIHREYYIVNEYTDSFYTAAGSKYNCFIAGDNPLSEIHNEEITDGSSIVLVKESYGNAFAPFLVDSYEYVYILDYRYYEGSLAEFVKEKGIDDVLFLNVVSNTSTAERLMELSEIIQ